MLEELYFTTAAAALDEGYQVILFEGPGQSHMIRYYGIPFTPRWDEVCHCVITAYEKANCMIHPKIGLGLSLGGLLIARAASADENLFDKIVLQNYFPSVIDSFKQSMPPFLYHFIEHGFPNWMLPLCQTYIHHQHFLNWQVEHAKWVFGQKHLNDLLAVCQNFAEPENLTTDCLLFVAEDENYYHPQLGIDFYNHITSKQKQLQFATRNNSPSTLHCQNGAAFYSNDVLFQWLFATKSEKNSQ